MAESRSAWRWSKAPWIVARDRDMSMHCLRCGEHYALTLPVLLAVWVAAAKAFAKVHRQCRAGSKR